MIIELKNILANYAKCCEDKLVERFKTIENDDSYSGKSKIYSQDLVESMKYSIFAGGKRIRPFLTMEFCKLFCGDEKRALSYAAALEMIHTYSLIHDDLPCMDNDTLRRGKPTNHVKFGESVALLAGDSLLTDAFYVLCDNNLMPTQNLKATMLLSKSAGPLGMALGQQIDLHSEGTNIPPYILELLQYKKTGALFSAACGLGCIAAEIYDDSPLYADAQQFALRLGLAFQITDDILDCIGNEKDLGKMKGRDEKKNKTTYTSQFGIKEASLKARNQVNYAISKLDSMPNNQCKENLISLAKFILTREN